MATPQQKAAWASARNRRVAAQERRAAEARRAWYRLGGVDGHAGACVCDECEAIRRRVAEAAEGQA